MEVAQDQTVDGRGLDALHLELVLEDVYGPLDEEAAIGDGHESPPPPGWEMHESEEHPGTLVVLVYTAGIHLIAVGSQRVLLTLHLLAWLLECKQVTTFTKTISNIKSEEKLQELYMELLKHGMGAVFMKPNLVLYLFHLINRLVKYFR